MAPYRRQVELPDASLRASPRRLALAAAAAAGALLLAAGALVAIALRRRRHDLPRDGDELDRAVRLDDPELAELVLLDGSSNAADLLARATARAAVRLNTPDAVASRRLLLAHPWPVNCDGVVAAVEVTMRTTKEGVPCGFETLITTGAGNAPLPVPGTTRARSRSPVSVTGAAVRRIGAALA